MLRQASVGNCIVLVISVDDGRLEPLLWLVSHEALASLEVAGAVHLTMGAEVRAEGVVLADCVLHEAASVVHLRVDHLTAGPVLLGEWGFSDVHDLEPSAHEFVLVELL